MFVIFWNVLFVGYKRVESHGNRLDVSAFY